MKIAAPSPVALTLSPIPMAGIQTEIPDLNGPTGTVMDSVGLRSDGS